MVHAQSGMLIQTEKMPRTMDEARGTSACGRVSSGRISRDGTRPHLQPCERLDKLPVGIDAASGSPAANSRAWIDHDRTMEFALTSERGNAEFRTSTSPRPR